MSKNFDFRSCSLKYDYNKKFICENNLIKSLVSEDIPNILRNNEFIKKQIKEYKDLNTFLGKKIKPNRMSETFSQQELDKFNKYIKIDEHNKIKKINLFRYNKNSYLLELTDINNYINEFNIYQKPLVIGKIFENEKSLDLDLIT